MGGARSSPLFPYTTLFRSRAAGDAPRAKDLRRVDADRRASTRRKRAAPRGSAAAARGSGRDRKSTRLNSSHVSISYAVFCLKKKTKFHVESRPALGV